MRICIKPFAWLIIHPASLVRAACIYTDALKQKRYLSTLPRSGTEYLHCMITSACDLLNGGNGEYYYENDKWVRNIEIACPSILHNFVAFLKTQRLLYRNFFMHAHHPIQKTNMFSIDSIKVVFTVRNIHDQLESWLLHTFDEPSAQDQFIKKGYVERIINHFNYWGDFIRRPGKTAEKTTSASVTKTLLPTPLANIRRVIKFWNFDIDDAILGKAVELCNREKMKSKIPSEILNSNKRLTVRENRGQLFSKENRDYIDRAIRDKLRYDFGYNYLNMPAMSS